MNNQVIENFKVHFPFIANNASEFIPHGEYAVVAKLYDGDSVLYDDLDKTIRTLPANSEEMTEEECRKEFGLRLRMRLYRQGITLKELSQRTGLHENSISNYVRGKVTPGFFAVDKIAKVLGCSTEEFRYLD